MAAHLWFFSALGASILWGFGYAIIERLLELKITPPFLLFIFSVCSVPVFFAISLMSGDLKSGFELFKTDHKVLWLTLGCLACYIIADLLIFYSIVGKNVTLTSFIEISYPIFTVFFIWLLYGKIDLNVYTLIGGTLIFTGVGLIFFKA